MRLVGLWIVVATLTSFGPGLQFVSSLFVPAMALLVHVSLFWDAIFFVPLFLGLFTGNTIAFLFSFSLKDNETSQRNSAVFVSAMSAPLSLLIVLMLVLNRFVSKTLRWSSIPVLPPIWASFWLILVLISPVGSWTNSGYSSFGWTVLEQLGAFGGLSLINFAMALLVTVIVELNDALLGTRVRLNLLHDDDPTLRPFLNRSLQDYGEDESGSQKMFFYPKKRTLLIAVIALFILLFCGGFRLVSDGLFQRSAKDIASEGTLEVTCLVSGNLHRTKAVLEAGSKFVFWSEGAVSVATDQELEFLRSEAAHLSRLHSAHVGISYLDLRNKKSQKNMFVFFTPNGTSVLDYQKSHPVFIIEDNLTPGPKKVQFFDDPYLGIRIGVAICFDFDFPQFIRQAGQNNVDLMLQPSETWGPIGAFHASMDSFRSIENGFTMVRCSDYGESRSVDNLGRLISRKASGKKGTYIAEVPFPRSKFTLYSAIGDTMGWLCLAYVVVILGLAFRRCISLRNLSPA